MTRGRIETRRTNRRDATREHRRSLILDAARRVFTAKGLEGASVRDIAAEAGYTPGAIYFYFPGKEAVYGEMLANSLRDLGAAVKSAVAEAGDPQDAVKAGPRAFYSYYAERPDELDLSFYLFRGIQPRGLTPEIDRQLNGRLIAVLRAISDAIDRYAPCPEQTANEETVAAVTQMCGILLLRNSGRLKILGIDPERLAGRYLDDLVARLDRLRR